MIIPDDITEFRYDTSTFIKCVKGQWIKYDTHFNTEHEITDEAADTFYLILITNGEEHFL